MDRKRVNVASLQVLSSRQRDVLACLFNGDSEKEIAVRLSISVLTVHTHVKRLHAKLGVHNRGQLLRAALGD
jgi:DNA-binding CsgD family transcriptional regulator